MSFVKVNFNLYLMAFISVLLFLPFIIINQLIRNLIASKNYKMKQLY